jgi:hypothetical protein
MSTQEPVTPDSTSVSAQSPQESQEQLRKYNYEHFWPKHLFADLWRSVQGEGLQPGTLAPDFELESTEGDWLRLSALRGRPVVVHIGSFT